MGAKGALGVLSKSVSKTERKKARTSLVSKFPSKEEAKKRDQRKASATSQVAR